MTTAQHHPLFTAATQVFNLAAPLRPAAALTAHTIADIRAAIHHADREKLALRVHTTGHGAPTASPMRGALLIRTLLNTGIEIDPQRRLARFPAGTRWGEVVDAAAKYGLAVPHGSSPDVGAVGFLLRGGVSFYGRHTGLAANSVRAIELVTADGELRRTDAEHDPELFWALRGGGGGFGVVTAVEIDLFPAAAIVTGAAFWPVTHAQRLVETWQRWTLTAPRTAATSLRVMNLPKVPAVPAMLSAGPVVCIDGLVLARTNSDTTQAQHQADELLGPLREIAEPLQDTWQPAEPPAAVHTHMDPREPVAVFGDHMLLTELGPEGMSRFLDLTGEHSDSPLVNAELRQLGGALAEPGPNGGAVDHFDAQYSYIGAGILLTGATADEIKTHCARVRAALRPWDTGQTAPTFVESYEQPQGILTMEEIRAVDRVRLRVDPQGRFHGDIARNATALAAF